MGLLLTGSVLGASLVFAWLPVFSLIGHPQYYKARPEPLPFIIGYQPSSLYHFFWLLLSIVIPYLLALAVAARARGRLALVISLVASAIFGCMTLVMYPAGATDIFHNIMDGRLLWVHHLNPMLNPPAAAASDPLYDYLVYWQTKASNYGPLWYLLTGPAVLIARSSVQGNLLAFKAIPFAAELASLGLIAMLVGRLCPRRQVAAVVCFGWSPLVLWEIAGNGHNDIVMMFFVLLAILFLFSKRWPLAFPALACSILVKYVSLILLPILVLWVLRRHGRRALLPLAWGFLGAAYLTAIICLPLWAGSATFRELRAQQNFFISSPAAALIGNWGENLPNVATVTMVKNGLTLAFLMAYGLVLLRLKPTPEGLIRASVEATFLFLVLMVWWFWPWYVLWTLALGTLLPGTAHGRLTVLFSITALLVYICFGFRDLLWNVAFPFALPLGTALAVFAAPVLYAIMEIWLPSDWRKAGTPPAPAREENAGANSQVTRSSLPHANPGSARHDPRAARR